MNLNKIILVGRLTRDVELKDLPSGSKVANFGLATNRTYKANDEKKTDTEFHNIVAFGKSAEIITQYCKKGAELLIEGRIQTKKWKSQDGTERQKTEIVVENFQLGQKPKGLESE